MFLVDTGQLIGWSLEIMDWKYLPSTAGARALIWIASRSSCGARERTSPITPNLDAAYSGATAKGYRPAFDAVHMMDPLDETDEPFTTVFFLI